jgi:hypothetical protein
MGLLHKTDGDRHDRNWDDLEPKTTQEFQGMGEKINNCSARNKLFYFKTHTY